MPHRLNTAVTLMLQFSHSHHLIIPAPLQQAMLLPAYSETLSGKLAGAWRYQSDFSYQYGAEPGLLTKKITA